MIKIEHNVSTGEIIEKTLTKAEVVILEKQRTEVQAKITQFENQATIKLALLDKLGITEEEAQAIFG